ncbi:MAG TPA: protein kinase [Archangium sp.]|uniref:serine/threonine protein kinase n=1 Tax=Archangium sp. TaxID=1872627 RepID=UPI002E33F01B|nr:protein kinase [Archangium sp.]HEX5754636.1 protein kinase [Archangium sp.]
MSDDTRGRKAPASGLPVLFSQGGTDYLRLQKLEEGPFGEKLYLCRPRTGQMYGALVEVAVLDRQGRRIGHARMIEAARLGALLSHPAIPRVHGQYKHRGTRYLVTEYVSGISMNMACSSACVRDRPLSESFILYVASRVAGVLSYVHGLTDAEGRQLRIIHRNVNPYTLLMRDDGEVMLAHFTAAFSRLPGREPTTTWKVRGELDFAAPERLCRAVDAPVDERSDQFSLGLVMLELATGEHLYHTEEVERAAAHLPPPPAGAPECEEWRAESDSWTSVEEMARRAAAFRPEHVSHLTRAVSGPLRSILHKLLNRHPSQRYPTAAALKADLDACLAASHPTYGAREALAELLEARAEAERIDSELFASDEAVRTAGEAHALAEHGSAGA